MWFFLWWQQLPKTTLSSRSSLKTEKHKQAFGGLLRPNRKLVAIGQSLWNSLRWNSYQLMIIVKVSLRDVDVFEWELLNDMMASVRVLWSRTSICCSEKRCMAVGELWDAWYGNSSDDVLIVEQNVCFECSLAWTECGCDIEMFKFVCEVEIIIRLDCFIQSVKV